ncbi:MAG TPA: hypothetical protein DEF04_13565 [Clostridiales bacterium]|nr:hypothetical protein [Clostridiales bacterium]
MKKIKKLLSLYVLMVLIVSSQNKVFAEQFIFEGVDYVKSEDIRVVFDGKQIEFDVKPQIVNGRTLVPVRAIFEAVGLNVEWNEESRTVIGYNKDASILIKFEIGSQKAIYNEDEKVLDVPASISDGRIMVPLRFLSESMGYNVVWIDKSDMILMSKEDVIEWRVERYETKDSIKKYESMYVNGEKTSQTRYKQYPDNVIALVNGREITRESYDMMMAVHRFYYGEEDYCLEYLELTDNFVYAYEGDIVLHWLIENEALIYAAERYGVNMSDEEFEAKKPMYLESFYIEDGAYEFYNTNENLLEYMLNNYKNNEIMLKYYELKFGKDEPSEEELRQYEEIYRPRQIVETRHILVKTEEEAIDALNRLKNDENFYLLAEELNIDSSKEYGGDIGYINYDEITSPYADAVFSMEVGEIRGPVKTRFGYHIIELLGIEEDGSVEPGKKGIIDAYNYHRQTELDNRLVNEAEIVIKDY